MKRFFAIALMAFLTIGDISAGSVASAASGGSHATGQRGIGIRLLDASTARRDDPRARIYVDDFVRPGTAFSRHVQVTDFTAKPVHLLLYAAPATITGEQFTVGDRGQRSELTDWMTVAPSSVDLQPGQSATVTVSFKVPPNASKGERYGAIIAELPAPKPAAGTVTVATRVGVRVYLAVGPGGEPASDFTISTLTAERLPDGTPAVEAHVTNTGGRALDLSGALTLGDGPGGLRAGPFPVRDIPTLGIHQTGNVIVPLDKQTPAGPWLAKMTLQSGYVKHAVEGTITFPSQAGTSGHPVKAKPVPLTKNRHVLVPIAIGLILALLVGLFLFLLWKRRRRDDDEEKQPKGGAPRLPGQRRAADERDLTH